MSSDFRKHFKIPDGWYEEHLANIKKLMKRIESEPYELHVRSPEKQGTKWMDSTVSLWALKTDQREFCDVLKCFLCMLEDAETSEASCFKYCWVYLIVNGPYPFDRAQEERPLFSAETFEQAEQLETLKAPENFETTRARILGRSSPFYRWAIEPENVKSARAYMALYCINMCKYHFGRMERPRAQHEFNQFVTDFSDYKCPMSYPFFSTESYKKLIRDDFQTKRTSGYIVGMILREFFLEPNDDSAKKVAFLKHAIVDPFEYHGLLVVKLLDDINPEPEYCKRIFKLVDNGRHDGLRFTLRLIFHLKKFLKSVTDQDPEFLEQNPQYKGQTVRLWKYSRILDPYAFVDLSLTRNLRFASFMAGFSSSERSKILSSFALKDQEDREHYANYGQRVRIRMDLDDASI